MKLLHSNHLYGMPDFDMVIDANRTTSTGWSAETGKATGKQSRVEPALAFSLDRLAPVHDNKENLPQAGTRQAAASAADFTLALSGKDRRTREEPASSGLPDLSSLQRAKLPYSFNFGIRRPTTVALAQRYMPVNHQLPLNPALVVRNHLHQAATTYQPPLPGQTLSVHA